MQKSDFVLLDVRTDTLAPTWMLKLLTSSPDFGLYAAADGIVLYKQGYHMAPIFFSPIENLLDRPGSTPSVWNSGH